ncbi:ABC transporter, ATP-binding protein [Acetoanaerobium sticklandii]|uniref:ABC transporter, ATP-binding protein n=1 Tax=Acetoanaerobium sticklandii (strain ATCC 12662 / DSM 519 / JCM 1433 / CCUG 9281 / NCIMB 10654 / HF) TaxID=499177 RepID=E3PVQ7_ACESD|nr:ABC transporter ATP-binding protein [Acetoanaerobium sticklandii]CBH22610.1 ABC transporter, ATP-binding protein [Acetoanaerobium sticklandii]
MIKVKNISKSYKDAVVLNNVSLEINKGDFTAVMGPSGSGKSTLLYSISSMDNPDEGEVVFEGIDVYKLSESELSKFRLNKMGFVFQNSQLLKNLSIFDNIILPGMVAKRESIEVVRARATELMSKMGIEDIKDRDIREVSGGQLQRAAICRAMINSPEILFMDEPTGALNSEAASQVMEILKKLNQEGISIMLVTHDAKMALMAKKVIYIKDGKLAGEIKLSNEKEALAEIDLWLKTI